ncbi:MAG: hypothetical protein ABR526_07815 [Chthoniobacterales bacterium]
MAALALLLFQTAKRAVTTEKQSPKPIALPAGADEKSLAVLPFVNMSSDKENEYFVDGLTEEILNRLAQTSALKVPGRTSSFVFKEKKYRSATDWWFAAL